jgi:hypothetical protein
MTNGILQVKSDLQQAAEALVQIDRAGSLAELGDWIGSARREHRRCELDRTIGEKIYIDQLANTLHATTGIDRTKCWFAISDAVRPSWSTVALAEIISFAKRTEPARRVA